MNINQYLELYKLSEDRLAKIIIENNAIIWGDELSCDDCNESCEFYRTQTCTDKVPYDVLWKSVFNEDYNAFMEYKKSLIKKYPEYLI